MPASSQVLDPIRVTFDDSNAVADAGLVLTGTLAGRLGLEQLVDDRVSRGYRPGRKLLTLVSTLLAGGDCIDDVDISSGGITASMDATLHTLARLVDRDVADATARELGYPHTRFLDEPAYQPESADTRPVAIARAFHRNQTDVALLLHDGVGEIELASIVDLYPRTATAAIHPVAVEDGLIRTRNGLHLLSDERLEDSGRDYDRLLIPGRPHPDIAAAADRWAADSSTSAPEPIHVSRPDSFPFDAALDNINEHHPAAITRAVVAGIEYPYPRQAQGSTSAGLLRRPLALGLLGLLAAAAVRRAWLATRHYPR